jgi:hypothetical protein
MPNIPGVIDTGQKEPNHRNLFPGVNKTCSDELITGVNAASN